MISEGLGVGDEHHLEGAGQWVRGHSGWAQEVRGKAAASGLQGAGPR